MKQMATMMAQWQATMAAGMAGTIPAAVAAPAVPGAPVGVGKARRPLRYCKNCKKEGYHEDDECYSLEKNKDKRPKWYKAAGGG